MPTITGDSGSNTLVGTSADDLIQGLDGTDMLTGLEKMQITLPEMNPRKIA